MASKLPVYLKIHDQIKSEIEEGKWHVGDRLPSEKIGRASCRERV